MMKEIYIQEVPIYEFLFLCHIGICGYKISLCGYYGRKEGNDETTR